MRTSGPRHERWATPFTSKLGWTATQPSNNRPKSLNLSAMVVTPAHATSSQRCQWCWPSARELPARGPTDEHLRVGYRWHNQAELVDREGSPCEPVGCRTIRRRDVAARRG